MHHLGKFASIVALAFAAAPVVSSASVFYSENFDTDNTANWTYNTSISGDTASRSDQGGAADFYFDYSTVGIPAAPGGTSTRGMIVQANLPGTNGGTGTFSGVSASPTGLVLPSSYKLTFYAWQNTVGAFPGGGSGSTQLTNVTVGASGTSTEFAGGTIAGVQFAASGDGGTNPDYRAYTGLMPHGSGGVLNNTDTGVYAAGDITGYGNNSTAYYAALNDGTSIQPPAAQAALYGEQTGFLAAGTPAFAWRQWEIDKTADSITWYIDGLKIATVPASLFPSAFGDNIAFGQADINTGPSTNADAAFLQFGLIDNISVSSVPEPASLSLLGLGGAALLGRRRRMA